jgi:hypothetical protein
MPRGYQLLARAAAGVGLLFLVAQCSSSSALSPDATTPAAATAPETSIVDTTAPPASTTPSTTVPESTTTVAPSTTTTEPEPTTTTVPIPVIDPNCPLTPHGAVIDRDRQRAWLCDNGVAQPEFVITTAREQPVPGLYPVFAKSMHASSRFGGHFSTMTHFVVFTRGKDTGARVGFHTVPVLRNGEFAQPLASLGTQLHHGDTSGCIRVLPDQGQVVWDWLQIGDQVHVVN